MPLVVALVRTFSPGNLGSAARAARAFGAELVLVTPRTDRDHPDARAFASGAEDLLDGAPVLETFRGVADHHVALTALRGRGGAGLPPAATWPRIRALARDRRVALVFGPERSGLTTEEIRACDTRLRLPTCPGFPTLNLAQAVSAALALAAAARPGAPREAAPAREVDRLLAAFRENLRKAGYPGPGRSAGVVAEMESFLRRGRPTSREVTLLLGALAALGHTAAVTDDRSASGRKVGGRGGGPGGGPPPI